MTESMLTLIPGPTPVHPRILEALAIPTTSHQDPTFTTRFRSTLDSLRRIVRTASAQPFVVAGSGTLAMEMALANLLAPGQRLLVISQGFFGDRWTEIASAFGIRAEVLTAEWGRAVAPERLRRCLEQGRFDAVAMTHVDTSTGTVAPVADYCALLASGDETILLDGVCATGGIDERFDEWGVDLLITGAQKALGAPPGVAILLASERAMERRRSRTAVPLYYADLLRWLPVMQDPSRYFSTPPVNEIVALDAALHLVLEEGLEARCSRHVRLGRAVRSGFVECGIEIFGDPFSRADTMTVACHPDGVDDRAFREDLARRHVFVAGAIGPLAGRAFRVGHMGNIGRDEIARLFAALDGALAASGRPVTQGRAARAALAALDDPSSP